MRAPANITEYDLTLLGLLAMEPQSEHAEQLVERLQTHMARELAALLLGGRDNSAQRGGNPSPDEMAAALRTWAGRWVS